MANMEVRKVLNNKLSFLPKLNIKDLVFLLSKSPNIEQFSEICTVDNLLTALEKWYGMENIPSAIHNGLVAAQQVFLAACIRKEFKGILTGSPGPNQLRKLMFNVAIQFSDSQMPDLHKELGVCLHETPSPKDSLEVMTMLIQKRLVTDSNITLLELLFRINQDVELLCEDYSGGKGGSPGSLDVGSGSRIADASCRTKGATTRRLAESHRMTNPMCLILNVNRVPGQDVRTGSEIDVDTLKSLFKKFHYSVVPLLDPDLAKWKKFIQDAKFALKNGNLDGLVFFVMSHGADDYVYLAEENARLHWWTDIVAPFLDGCLHGKPKVFFFQCCRGEKKQKVLSFDGLEQEKEKVSDQDNTELYVFHATFDGFVAVREDDKGTWFIQTLCQKLDVPERIEIDTLRLSVTNELSAKRAEVNSGESSNPILINQTPTVEKNTLTKKLFLKPL